MLPSTKVSSLKVKKSYKFHPKTTRNTSRSQLMQGLDTNIHCLGVELSGWNPLFVKTLKVILTKRFVMIKRVEILNVNMTTNNFQFVLLIFVSKCCFSYIAYPLPVIVKGICLFDNFEKLSMFLGFSRDILEG